ncbi:MAG: acyl-CoA thioesterase [Pseudomonadota bacterium]
MSTGLYKCPTDSDTTITELMIPAYANFGGKIHGGILLSMMDKVAYACASKHAETYCVTVSVEGVDFLQPVEVGDLVSMMARVNYVGRTSLVVGIRVTAENVIKQEKKHTNTSYFTMVAKDSSGARATVAGLKLSSEDDVRRFSEVLIRQRLSEYREETMKDLKDKFDVDEQVALLEQHNCVVDR